MTTTNLDHLTEQLFSIASSSFDLYESKTRMLTEDNSLGNQVRNIIRAFKGNDLSLCSWLNSTIKALDKSGKFGAGIATVSPDTDSKVLKKTARKQKLARFFTRGYSLVYPNSENCLTGVSTFIIEPVKIKKEKSRLDFLTITGKKIGLDFQGLKDLENVIRSFDLRVYSDMKERAEQVANLEKSRLAKIKLTEQNAAIKILLDTEVYKGMTAAQLKKALESINTNNQPTNKEKKA